MAQARETRLLIAGAGTATAWHLVNVATTDPFGGKFEIYTADTNPSHLIPASTRAKSHFQVLPVADPGYREQMLSILAKEDTDLFVPLIDDDVFLFPSDDKELNTMGVKACSVPAASAAVLRDKGHLSAYLELKNIPTPRHFADSDAVSDYPGERFFLKPRRGFGSRGARAVSRQEAVRGLECDDLLVQEICTPPEITIEVFNGNGEVRTMCRERLEVKAGVCTKARVWWDGELNELACALVDALEMPTAFCFQVMRDHRNRWVVTDVNPRIGAGTALCTEAGWSLVRAALAAWAELPWNPLDHVKPLVKPVYVARVYREILMPVHG